jgi:hypothetical protein
MITNFHCNLGTYIYIHIYIYLPFLVAKSNMNSITVTAHHGFILRLLWRHVWWRPTFPYTRSALADGHWWPCPRFLKRNQLWLLWCPGWWFGPFGLFFHILGRIIPTEFHIFQRGRRKTFQPDHVWSVFFPFMNLKKIAPKNIRSKVKHAADPGGQPCMGDTHESETCNEEVWMIPKWLGMARYL